ncbi:MAG: hypothetical protein RIF41_07760, partial [Polyangiaceae bacterium]
MSADRNNGPTAERDKRQADEAQRRKQRERAQRRRQEARATRRAPRRKAPAEPGPRSIRGVAGALRPGQKPTPPPRTDRIKRSWPRKLKFTREGKYFLGITLGVGFAAINTGNNLLYLLLGMMLSLIIVSGVMSELSLRTLTVKRRLPARAQVGRSHLVEIE